MERASIEVKQAGPERAPALAGVFAHAFAGEPMMRWPMGEHGDFQDRLTRCFAYVLEGALARRLVWEAQAGAGPAGAAIWFPPGETHDSEDHPWNQPRIDALTADGGARYDAFWTWVDSRTPDEPLWQLDSIAVEPASQGRGIGTALIEDGLARARAEALGVFLATASPGNVPFYEHRGFRVIEDSDAPNGGPHVWFMRWDP